jgi:hypothetical protein
VTVVNLRCESYVYVTVAVPDPHAPAFVVVVEVCINTPGITRTSSTKSATDL